MKKFLSVLLALAVAFTFTFGSSISAFAVETEAQKIDNKAAEQQKVIDEAVQNQLDAVVYGQDGYLYAIVGDTATNNQKLLTAAALAEGAKAAKAAGANAIAEVVRTQKIADVYDESKFTSITAGTIYNVAAYTYQFNSEKTAKTAEIAKVDANAYVAFDYDSAEGDQSDKAKVTAAIAAAKNAVDAVKIDASDSEAAIATKINTIKSVTVSVPAKTAAEYQKDLDDAKAIAKTTINGYADSLKTTLKNSYQSAADIATTPTDKAAAEAALAAVEGNVKTVADIYLAKVDAVAIDKDTKPGTGEGTVGAAVEAVVSEAQASLANEKALNDVLKQLANVDGLIDYAKNYAASLKTAREADGTIMYDSAVVDKALTEVIAGIKNASITTMQDVREADAFTNMVSIKDTAKALADYKGTKKADVDAISVADYAEAEVTKIEALKKAAKEAIDAAVDTDAVDAVITKLNADIAALPTSDQTDALAAAATKAIDETLEYDVLLDRLYNATVLAAADGVYTTDSDVKNDIIASAKQVMIDAVLANIDATKPIVDTEVEAVVKANLDAAKAIITGMPTVAAVEAQAAAVIAKIDAIPSTVTLDAKEAVVAADEAYKELVKVPAYSILATDKKVPLTKVNNLDTAKSKIQTLENAAACDAVKALKAKATLTDLDEAAYEAAKALSDAYYEAYGSYPSNNEINNIVQDLADIKAAIDNYKYIEAAKAIEAIPADVTIEDKAAVEAARAAYDALTDAQKATFSKDFVKKLEAAEAAIAELTKYTDIHAKADLLDMSRKLTIWRTTKTSIRVSAVGSVKNIKANGYTVKYSFYKKAPGSSTYKLVKTQSTYQYTYTNLKKGTNKFQVKVSVYDPEGKLVASKWTYYRAAKIK